MLIIEIILTIFAWKNGWRWLALLPVGIAIGIGFIIGLNGATMSDLSEYWWIDVLAIVALIGMLVKKGNYLPPNTQTTNTNKDTEETS